MSSFPPNTELVTVYWLKGIPDLNPDLVGTTLPRDNSTWAASGFVQVGPVSGGGPAVHIPVMEPVVSIHCWATRSGTSGKPPWGKANTLAMAIVNHCQLTPGLVPRQPVLPAQFNPAVVRTAYPMQDPRRAPGDPGAYAHYIFDLAIRWVPL